MTQKPEALQSPAIDRLCDFLTHSPTILEALAHASDQVLNDPPDNPRDALDYVDSIFFLRLLLTEVRKDRRVKELESILARI